MAKNIIIFQHTPDENNSLFGFKIFNQKTAKQFMHVVSILADSNEKFEFNDSLIDYDVENFEIMKISTTELKVLLKLFNCGEEEECVGVFPDAINDAYELGLISDDEEYSDDEYE